MSWGVAVWFAFPHEDRLVKKLGSHWSCFPLRELNVRSSLKFVHTSFHGVGHDYVQLAFKAFGFQPPIPVPEQKDPDPDFSTVKCPNPEEGESVLVFLVATSSGFCGEAQAEGESRESLLSAVFMWAIHGV